MLNLISIYFVCCKRATLTQVEVVVAQKGKTFEQRASGFGEHQAGLLILRTFLYYKFCQICFTLLLGFCTELVWSSDIMIVVMYIWCWNFLDPVVSAVMFGDLWFWWQMTQRCFGERSITMSVCCTLVRMAMCRRRLLFQKNADFTLSNGWAFPDRGYFNGDTCVYCHLRAWFSQLAER